MKVKAVLCVLLALSWGVLAWLWSRTSRQEALVASLEQQLRTPRASVLPPPAQATAPAPADAVVKPAEQPRRERQTVTEPPADSEAEALREKLQDSAADLAKLRARIGELETEVLNVMGDRARLSTAESEARARVAELTRTVESMNAERPASDKRLRDLETEVGRLKEQNAAAQRNTQASQLSAELQDITRRQQVYVTNILRRYREVTDVFRALPGMLESKGNGPELARIQTAISMADEDVRQLNDLSARLGRLEKRISANAGR